MRNWSILAGLCTNSFRKFCWKLGICLFAQKKSADNEGKFAWAGPWRDFCVIVSVEWCFFVLFSAKQQQSVIQRLIVFVPLDLLVTRIRKCGF